MVFVIYVVVVMMGDGRDLGGRRLGGSGLEVGEWLGYGDISDEERSELLERFWSRWGSLVDEVCGLVLRREFELVSGLRSAGYEDGDIRQELVLFLLRRAWWLEKKGWLDEEGGNVRAYFYQLLRNGLIDLWRRVSAKRRLPFACSLDEVLESGIELGSLVSGGELELVERYDMLLDALRLMVVRCEVLERILLGLDMECYTGYLGWWLEFRRRYLAGEGFNWDEELRRLGMGRFLRD